MTNKEIAKKLALFADLLEIKGDNPFKIRAYRNAARIIENSSKDFEKLVKEGFDLTKLPGIGKDLSEYIKEIVTTGEFSKLNELKKEIPFSLTELLSIEGLGPKRIKQLYQNFGIKSLEELKKFADEGKLEEIPGFGPKLIEKILKGIKQLKKAGIRFLYAEVEEIVNDLKNYLLSFRECEIVEVAGSFRRKKETVGDIDILVISSNYPKISELFIKYPRVKEVVLAGLTRSTVLLDSGLQVDLRAVSKESYGAALHYFTGSKAHNIAVRKLANEKGLKVNEYGVYRGSEKIAGESEEEVYKAIGLCYIEPELRENWGEIEACLENKLPKLVNIDDIKGDLHIHSKYSDGANTIEEIVIEAIKKGYEYIAITDHSKRLKVANGLSEEDLLKEFEEIDKLNEKYSEITILKGAEVDILEDGSLDYNEEILEKCDIVNASIHYKFNLNKNEQTKRLIKALNNPYVTILSHPTNRILNKRDMIDFDIDLVFEEAKKNNVFLEINSQPDRLDLPDYLIKKAVENGNILVINSDAHNINSLNYIKYGVFQARRGWCESKNILNTLSLQELLKAIKK